MKWWGRCIRCRRHSDFLAFVTWEGRRYKVCAHCYEAYRAKVKELEAAA